MPALCACVSLSDVPPSPCLTPPAHSPFVPAPPSMQVITTIMQQPGSAEVKLRATGGRVQAGTGGETALCGVQATRVDRLSASCLPPTRSALLQAAAPDLLPLLHRHPHRPTHAHPPTHPPTPTHPLTPFACRHPAGGCAARPRPAALLPAVAGGGGGAVQPVDTGEAGRPGLAVFAKRLDVVVVPRSGCSCVLVGKRERRGRVDA